MLPDAFAVKPEQISSLSLDPRFPAHFASHLSNPWVLHTYFGTAQCWKTIWKNKRYRLSANCPQLFFVNIYKFPVKKIDIYLNWLLQDQILFVKDQICKFF